MLNRYNTTAKLNTWIIEKWAEGSMEIDGLITQTYFLSSGLKLFRDIPLNPVMITSFTVSMAVNAMVTGLIVFKILKVFLEVKPTSVERTLGSTKCSKLRHIAFIIIESGMALFAVQLIRVVLSCLPLQPSTVPAFNFTIGINQMFNVIIRSVSFLLLLFY